MVQNVAEGTVVSVEDGSSAMVLFGAVGSSLPQATDTATLLPVDEVPPCLNGIAATGARVLKFLAELDTHFANVADDVALWRVEVKTRAFGALRFMLQDLEFARYAVQADLLPTLFRAALHPVKLLGFPSVDRVEAQWVSAVARLLEASRGTHYCHEVKGAQHAATALAAARRAAVAQPATVGEEWNADARLRVASSSGNSSGSSGSSSATSPTAALGGYAGITPPLIDDGSATTLTAVQDPEERKRKAVTGANASVTASAQLFQGSPEATLANCAGASIIERALVVSTAADNEGPVQLLRGAGPVGNVHSGGGGLLHIRVLHTDAGLCEHVSVPTANAKIVTDFFDCPLAGGVAVLKTLAAVTGRALASHWARKCVLSLLLSWPSDVPFTLGKLGGTGGLVALAKMVSSGEDIFGQLREEHGNSLGGASPVVDGLRARIMWIIGQEGKAVSWAGMTWKCPVCTLVNEGEVETCVVCQSPRPAMQADTEKLSDKLVTECVASLLTATNVNAEGASSKQSSHPAMPGRSSSGCVRVRGATALWISFNPQCSTMDHKDSGLFFFADSRQRRTLAAFRGPPQNFRPFVVYSDQVHYSFRTAGCDSSSWGFAFTARPISGLRWLRETEVLTQPSLEWGCWLLAFLLTDVRRQLTPGALHTPALFKGLIHYLQQPNVPFKHRIIKLLTQLASTPEQFTADFPIARLSALDPILCVLGLAWLGLAWLGLAWLGLACVHTCAWFCFLCQCFLVVWVCACFVFGHVWVRVSVRSCTRVCMQPLCECGGPSRGVGTPIVPRSPTEAAARVAGDGCDCKKVRVCMCVRTWACMSLCTRVLGASMLLEPRGALSCCLSPRHLAWVCAKQIHVCVCVCVCVMQGTTRTSSLFGAVGGHVSHIRCTPGPKRATGPSGSRRSSLGHTGGFEAHGTVPGPPFAVARRHSVSRVPAFAWISRTGAQQVWVRRPRCFACVHEFGLVWCVVWCGVVWCGVVLFGCTGQQCLNCGCSTALTARKSTWLPVATLSSVRSRTFSCCAGVLTWPRRKRSPWHSSTLPSCRSPTLMP